MNDYIHKVTNYNADTIKSIGSTEGYFDFKNTNTATLSTQQSWINRRRNGSSPEGDKFRYEFVLSPSNGFLQNLEPLVKDCELKLRFERSQWNVPIQAIKDDPVAMNAIELKDIYAVTEYISSPHWRQYFDKINGSPIMYEYQESEAIIKTLPQNETELPNHFKDDCTLMSYLYNIYRQYLRFSGQHVSKHSQKGGNESQS